MHPCSSGILKGMGSWLEELWLPDHGSDHGSDLPIRDRPGPNVAKLISCPGGLVSKLITRRVKQGRKKCIA